MLEILAPVFVSGLADAALFFLVAAGLTFIFGVLRILNVAHGSFYSLGAYMAVITAAWLAAANWAPFLVYPLMLLDAAFVALLLGPAVERVFVRRTYNKSEATQILVTFGVFLILEDIQKLLFGVQAYYNEMPVQLLGTVHLGGLVYPSYQLLLIILAVLTVLLLRVFLRRSPLGKVIRAVAIDREISLAMGVNTDRIFVLSFTFGTFLAAFGGVLASGVQGAAPGLGAEATVLGFALAAIGGLGQIEGAAIAAVLVGVGRALAVYFAPEVEAVVPYLLMVAVLLFRPYGLLGAPQMRRV